MTGKSKRWLLCCLCAALAAGLPAACGPDEPQIRVSVSAKTLYEKRFLPAQGPISLHIITPALGRAVKVELGDDCRWEGAIVCRSAQNSTLLHQIVLSASGKTILSADLLTGEDCCGDDASVQISWGYVAERPALVISKTCPR